jgi:hypothetical protein
MKDNNEMSKKSSALLQASMDQNYHAFKEGFKEIFLENVNKECRKVEREALGDVAWYGLVQEGISIPLDNPDIKDASLFAIENDDEDNLVLKFNLDGDEKTFPVPEEDSEFYNDLMTNGFDDADDKTKEKIAMDLNDFVADVDVDKKDDSVERGKELDGDVELKMETDMSKLKGEARLKALKRLAEKKKLERSKKMAKEEDGDTEDLEGDEDEWMNDLDETEEAKKKRMSKKIVKEASYQKDLDPDKPIIVSGVKGASSKPFKKKFANQKALDKWYDSPEYDDVSVRRIENA